MISRVARKLWTLGVACLMSCNAAAIADAIDPQPSFPRMPPKERLTAPKELTLEDLFPRAELPVVPVTAYPLGGTQIPSLTDKSVKELGLNHFVVITNTSFKTFADIYRDNRLRGKPNFVTADCVIHPYIAFTNGIAANVVAGVAPDLQALLIAMYNSAGGQYKTSQDASLRTDAEKNCAYLGVALKLLNPALQVAPVGQSATTITKELQNIQAGKVAHSAVFDRSEDFSAFKPIGWYNAAPQFANFYRCHRWLSSMHFTLSDPDTSADDSASSEFRRSVLLFQNLQQAKVGSATGLQLWQRLSGALDTIGTVGNRERLLLPSNYASVFVPGEKISLAGLAEPFYRTKLLLSIRRQRPVEIGAASIFNATEQKNSADSTAFFRLFPPTEDPELSWMRERAHSYTAEGVEGPDSPLALFDVYAHGAAQASNLLAENIWHMDPSLTKVLPSLVKAVKQPSPAPSYSMGGSRWQILSTYFKPMADGAQPALRSSLWLTRRLESAFAGWLDGHISVAPMEGGVQSGGASSSSNASTLASATKSGNLLAARSSESIATSAVATSTIAKNEIGATASVAAAKFQYLDPCPELYRRIAQDTDELQAKLSAQGLVTDEIKSRLDDFRKLSARLAAIADKELAYKAVAVEDMRLLANIDQVLEKISFPVQGTVYLNSLDTSRGGCNLGLGRPGYLHILCHTTRGVMLCRGALYTYYEIPGAAIKPEHWDRKLEFAMVRPPSWVSDFDLVQDALPVRANK